MTVEERYSHHVRVWGQEMADAHAKLSRDNETMWELMRRCPIYTPYMTPKDWLDYVKGLYGKDEKRREDRPQAPQT